MAARHRTLSFAKRGFDFEIFMRLFVRLAALAMYLGARTQVNLADLIRWSFMPDSNHVLMNTTLNDIANADAWASLFWKIMGSTFVAFAAAHGMHGLLSVIEDYLKNRLVRRLLRIVGLVLTLVVIAIGIYVLWTR
jgi:succinate dehydrogenase hydrophobic anchor subunit